MRIVCGLMLAVALLAGQATGAASDRIVPIPREKPEPPPAFLRGAFGEAMREAFTLAQKGRVTAALRALPRDADELSRDLVQWVGWTAGGAASFESLRDFIETHPDWPRLSHLAARVERAITSRTPDADILAWFAANPPRTGEGRIALAEALFRAGREAEAAPFLVAGWHTAGLSSPEERRLLARYGTHFSIEDHIARVDHLLWQRARRQASRLFGRLPDGYRRLAEARSALMAFAWNVDAAVAAVPQNLRDDPGLVHDRVYWRRIKGKHEGARELLLSTAVDGARILRPDRWWQERHLQARRALRRGEVEIAYRLAAEHALLDGHDFEGAQDDEAADIPLGTRAQIAEAEWLAGWVALRFLGRPADALRHFDTMYKVVGYPVSLARGAYWAARAAEALEDAALARRWFEEAARHPTTFYGQLAADRLGGDLSIVRHTRVEPTPEARARFESLELARAARLLALVGADRALGHFIRHMTVRARTPAEHTLVADFGAELDRPDLGVIVAKTAVRDGTLLVDQGYPVIVLDGEPPDRQSLILAIARQESQFDPKAVSRVGALGLMQLMPATANRVARQIGYPYSRQRLLSDPDYNLTLGSSYFATLLERFEGSPVLALAAYNAGPGAVNRWLRDNGDPRDFSADPVDWIELIPYSETRNYVQRVLEAAPIYGVRLAAGAPESLGAFLELGRRAPTSAGRPGAPAAPGG